MSDFVNTIDQLGDDIVVASIIEKTITEFRDNLLTTIGAYSFFDCKSLTTVDVPNATVLYDNSFNQCIGLSSVNLPYLNSIGVNAFYNCSKLTALILRSPTMCVATGNPCNSAYQLYIYVPSVLIDSYKSATNWSNHANKFRALEDYTVDGTTTGELDPNKI